MEEKGKGEPLWWWTALVAIALCGLALRVASAHGGLWTDEAWSVIYAAQARDPLGVFLRINHDNNHHLNSLWLQAIGPAASPFLARAPAILSGCLCIFVAAIIAARRSLLAGVIAALLFAISPTMVVFGSEARGYSMMLLAALGMLLLVGDVVDDRRVRGAPWWLGLLSLLGMLSHMTMAAPVGIACLWVYLEFRSKFGPDSALARTLLLMGPALFAVVGVVLFVATAAMMSPTGMRVGGYEPFSARPYMAALDDLVLWSAGLGTPWALAAPLLLGACAFIVGARRPKWLGSRALLYALMVVGLPLAVAILRPGNAGFARYYLASAIGLLLFLSEWIARGLSGRPSVRASAICLLATLVGASLYRDSVLISDDRGHPAAALRDVAALSPKGARIAFAEPRLKAVVAVAAERSGYPARFAGGCATADYLLAVQSRWTRAPLSVERCGVSMDAVDSSVTIPLSGDSWVLYRARNLQSFGAADSGPAPGMRNRSLSVRAGVAQG